MRTLRKIFDVLFARASMIYARFPLRRRGTWAALIALAGTAGIELGIPELVEFSEAAQTALVPVWNVLVLAGFVKAGEQKVTPNAAPRDDSGTPLVPVDAGQTPLP